jgi:hypothetical protein
MYIYMNHVTMAQKTDCFLITKTNQLTVLRGMSVFAVAKHITVFCGQIAEEHTKTPRHGAKCSFWALKQ